MKINLIGGVLAHIFLSMSFSIVVAQAGVDQDERSGSLH